MVIVVKTFEFQYDSNGRFIGLGPNDDELVITTPRRAFNTSYVEIFDIDGVAMYNVACTSSC